MRPAVGQRFYYLEIAGARAAKTRRSSEVNLTLDFPGDEVRTFIYLSEADAQEIAAKVRRRELTSVITLAKRVYATGVDTAIGGDLLYLVIFSTVAMSAATMLFRRTL